MKWGENERHYPSNLQNQISEAQKHWEWIELNINQVLSYMEDHEPTKMELNDIAKARKDMTFVRARLRGIMSSLDITMQKEVIKAAEQGRTK